MVTAAALAECVVRVIEELEEQGWARFDPWTIMPNHVYALALIEDDRSMVVGRLKGKSARFANLVLGKSGSGAVDVERVG